MALLATITIGFAILHICSANTASSPDGSHRPSVSQRPLNSELDILPNGSAFVSMQACNLHHLPDRYVLQPEVFINGRRRHAGVGSFTSYEAETKNGYVMAEFEYTSPDNVLCREIIARLINVPRLRDDTIQINFTLRERVGNGRAEYLGSAQFNITLLAETAITTESMTSMTRGDEYTTTSVQSSTTVPTTTAPQDSSVDSSLSGLPSSIPIVIGVGIAVAVAVIAGVVILFILTRTRRRLSAKDSEVQRNTEAVTPEPVPVRQQSTE